MLGEGQGRVFRQEPGATVWPGMARLSFLLEFQGQFTSRLLPVYSYGDSYVQQATLYLPVKITEKWPLNVGLHYLKFLKE